MITRSTKTIFAALVLLALMAFIAVSIPHPLDPVDTVNEQHVKETTAGGSGMPIGTYVLAELNDGKFALFFKECHICSIPFRQVGPGWGQGQFRSLSTSLRHRQRTFTELLPPASAG
jgi:hypothetical protein